MKKHSKLCAIFLTALLSISAVSFSVSAVGEEVDPGGDSSVIVDPVEPEPEPEPDDEQDEEEENKESETETTTEEEAEESEASEQ